MAPFSGDTAPTVTPAKAGVQSGCDGMEWRRFQATPPQPSPPRRRGSSPSATEWNYAASGDTAVTPAKAGVQSGCDGNELLPRRRAASCAESYVTSPCCWLGTSSGLDPRLRGGDGWARVSSTVVFLDRQTEGLATSRSPEWPNRARQSTGGGSGAFLEPAAPLARGLRSAPEPRAPRQSHRRLAPPARRSWRACPFPLAIVPRLVEAGGPAVRGMVAAFSVALLDVEGGVKTRVTESMMCHGIQPVRCFRPRRVDVEDNVFVAPAAQTFPIGVHWDR